MATYAIEATLAGGLYMNVRIVHDSSICQNYGIPCNAPRQEKTTNTGGPVIMGFADDLEHYFRATPPISAPGINTNIWIPHSVLGGRYIEFQF
jgi:hypothetical protein